MRVTCRVMGCMVLAFGVLLTGAQPTFAQDRSIDPGTSAVSLNGRIGQRISLTCPAISEARNSIYGTDRYTADSPVCQAALHAGVLRPGQAGTVTIEIGPGASEYTGSRRNGVTTRSYGPYSSSYTFVGTEASTTPGIINAPSVSPTLTAIGPLSNDLPAPAPTTPETTTPASTTSASSGATGPTAANDLAKKMLVAVAQAINMWQQQAQLSGQVTGIHLRTAPGGLSGPSLAPLIKLHLAGQGIAQDTVDKFAQTFGDAWQQWQNSFRISQQPAYPSFAAWPGPHAPPTPNVPFAIATGISSSALSANILRSALLARFPGATPELVQTIETFTTVIANNINNWRSYTMFTNVMGTGPVPTFAPPAVPDGQVTGTTMMLPGGLVGPPFMATGIP